MKNEKIASVVLVIIIVGALCTWVTITYGGDFLNDLFTDSSIELGDCADIHYIGSFASNGTVFATSYNDSLSKTGGTPKKIFVNPNGDLQRPTGEKYLSYSASLMQGLDYTLLNELVGMKKGQTKTVTLSPEDAYGDWDDTAAEEMFTAFGFSEGRIPRYATWNITETTTKSWFSLHLPEVNLAENITFDYWNYSQGIPNVVTATIINISDNNVTYVYNPVNGSTYYVEQFKYNETILVVNETTFQIRTDPTVGTAFTTNVDPPMHMKVIDVNETSYKLTINMLAPSLEFIGQTLIFEFEVIEVYKTSQEIS